MAHESMRTFSIMMSFNRRSPSLDIPEEIVQIFDGRIVETRKDVTKAKLVRIVRYAGSIYCS